MPASRRWPARPAAQAQIDELTARLRELNEAISDLQVTRKTLLSLAGQDETSPPPDRPAAPALPDHPAYQQILPPSPISAVPCARDLCVALDLPFVSKNTENIRSKLKRLASRASSSRPNPGCSPSHVLSPPSPPDT